MTREGVFGFVVSKTQGEFAEIWLQSPESKLDHWALLTGSVSLGKDPIEDLECDA